MSILNGDEFHVLFCFCTKYAYFIYIWLIYFLIIYFVIFISASSAFFSSFTTRRGVNQISCHYSCLFICPAGSQIFIASLTRRFAALSQTQTQITSILNAGGLGSAEYISSMWSLKVGYGLDGSLMGTVILYRCFKLLVQAFFEISLT